LSRPPATSDGKLHLFNHALPERWYLMGVMLSAGLSYRWFRDELAPLEKAAGQVTGIDAFELLNREAASAPPGAGGVLFLPYLNGERTPHADPHARGTFFGISSAHRRAHLVRAVMEGITFGLRDSLELMRATGQPVSRLRAIGGGAKSGLWLQIQADILDAVVERPAVDEGPAHAAALLAAGGGRRDRRRGRAAGGRGRRLVAAPPRGGPGRGGPGHRRAQPRDPGGVRRDLPALPGPRPGLAASLPPGGCLGRVGASRASPAQGPAACRSAC